MIDQKIGLLSDKLELAQEETYNSIYTLSGNAVKILEKRYLQRDSEGNLIETPEELFWRVAIHIAKGSGKYGSTEVEIQNLAKNFFHLMITGAFLPNSPTLVNAGCKKGCLSACFCISPDDTLESIMKIHSDASMIEKWGGGIGFGFSKLRPSQDRISSTHGKALGVINTMKIYSYSASKITQGSFRLGAHMGQLIVSHPEIFDFIHCKDNFDELKNFNISVQITDDFMNAVINDSDWELINPRDGSVYSTCKARSLWDELCESAHRSGDPGIAFMDRVWETAPNPHLGKIQTSNPCGEENLEDYASCNLGSLNLSRFVNTEYPSDFDWMGLESAVRYAVQFLDNVIDVNEFPLKKLKDMNLSTRRIGLGVMGWADALMLMQIPYDSEKAFSKAREVSKFIKETAWAESASLAEKRGAYPEFEKSALKEKGMPPVRNSNVITIAPTGTISRIAGCSSGIEPHYSLAWYSNVLWEDHDGKSTQLIDAPEAVRSMIKEHILRGGSSDKDEDYWAHFAHFGDDFDFESEQYADAVVQGVLKEIIENPDATQEVLESCGINPATLRTSMEITADDHVRMQAAWQENTTNAVSKTINMPNDATVEDVQKAYMLAWELNCKGITIYRAGSREVEVLTTSSNSEDKTNMKHDTLKPNLDIPPANHSRPENMQGVTTRMNTGHGSMYITLNSNGSPYEIFSSLGKSGGCHSAYLEALSRLVSLGLQNGVPADEITKQLRGITCCPSWSNGTQIQSPADAIAYAMSQHFLGISDNHVDSSGNIMKCIECSGVLANQEGCLSCLECGWSKCN